MAVGDLHPHPRNPRRGDVDGVASSLKQFGQVRPILAMRDGTIVAGNHTYQAALKLGWTHVAAVLLDLTTDEADAYLIADNRWSDVASYDYELLLAQVKSLADRDLLHGVGYDEEGIAELEQTVANLPELELPPDPEDPRAAARGA